MTFFPSVSYVPFAPHPAIALCPFATISPSAAEAPPLPSIGFYIQLTIDEDCGYGDDGWAVSLEGPWDPSGCNNGF